MSAVAAFGLLLCRDRGDAWHRRRLSRCAAVARRAHVPHHVSEAIPTMTSPTSACPDLGIWRAWLDREESASNLQTHLDDCSGCQAVVADIREGALAVSGLLDKLAPTSVPTAAETAIA